MNNSSKEAIIDTDLMNKITQAPHIADGKELFIRTMEELDVRPVVHYYVAEREMVVCNSIAADLIKSGYIKVYDKNDFVRNKEDESLYLEYFRKWYNFLNVEQPLEKDIDIFKLYRAGHSLGEIHSTLLAYFLKADIIMSDDSDTRDLVSYSGLRGIKVWNLVDVYSYIGQKKEKKITLKEVESIIRSENSRDSAKQKRIKKEKYNKVKEIWKIHNEEHFPA